MHGVDSELTIYYRLLGPELASPNLSEMPPTVRLPREALGDLPAQLLRRSARPVEFSQYVDCELRHGRYISSPIFEGAVATVTAPDLRRPTWRLLDALRLRRLVRVLAWHTHGDGRDGNGPSSFSLSDVVTISLLPPHLRSPIQLATSGDSLEVLFVTADTRRLVPLGWPLRGRPPVKLFRHMRALLEKEVLAGMEASRSLGLSDGYRTLLAGAAGRHFGLAYYSGSATTQDGFFLLDRLSA